MDKQQEFALRTVEERDVRFIRLWFTDVLGTLKSVAIAPAELEAAFEEGLGFDGSAIEGMTRVSEDDMIVQPDPSTFQILPWRGGPQGTARMFCDILTPDGEPSLGDPRHVLKRTLAKAKDKGFTFYVHPEIEFYLFESQDDWSKAPTPIDEGGYFDHVPRSPGMDFRRATVNMLEQMGISVEYSHHEAGPGQNEIDLRYADALTMADNIMTFRTVVKEISLERGIHASFMPKPLADAPATHQIPRVQPAADSAIPAPPVDDPTEVMDSVAPIPAAPALAAPASSNEDNSTPERSAKLIDPTRPALIFGVVLFQSIVGAGRLAKSGNT